MPLFPCRSEVEAFAKTLKEHHKAVLPSGGTVLDRAVVQVGGGSASARAVKCVVCAGCCWATAVGECTSTWRSVGTAVQYYKCSLAARSPRNGSVVLTSSPLAMQAEPQNHAASFTHVPFAPSYAPTAQPGGRFPAVRQHRFGPAGPNLTRVAACCITQNSHNTL